MSETQAEQIARINELLQKVWQGSFVEMQGTNGAPCVIGPAVRSGGVRSSPEHARFNPHPRALDALEAAVCVLSVEPLSVCLNAEIQLALNDRMARKAIDAGERAEKAESQLAELRALAREMCTAEGCRDQASPRYASALPCGRSVHQASPSSAGIDLARDGYGNQESPPHRGAC